MTKYEYEKKVNCLLKVKFAFLHNTIVETLDLIYPNGLTELDKR